MKALRDTGARTRRNLSPVRSEEYTAVVAVVFDEHLRVQRAVWIPREVVVSMFEVRSHVNGRVIRLTRRLFEHPDVTDLTVSDASLDG